MTEQKPEPRRHFLYHIFRMDKAEHPMPPRRAEETRQNVTGAITDKHKKERK